MLVSNPYLYSSSLGFAELFTKFMLIRNIARNLGRQWKVLTFDPSIMRGVILHSIGREETVNVHDVAVTAKEPAKVTSFPGSLSSASLVVGKRDLGRGWSRDHPESEW